MYFNFLHIYVKDKFIIMIKIPLVKFVLEVPNIDALFISPVGLPFVHEDYGVLFQRVYYTLNNTDGKAFETGNKDIPMDTYLLVQKYLLGTIDAADITTLNAFFVTADWPLVAVLPVVEAPEEI